MPFPPVLLSLLLSASPGPAAFVPLAADRDAWAALPDTVKGDRPALPPWARATAVALPRTTAAMLELDVLHRVNSPLPARLRGMMRYAAADANRCDYTRKQALADLRKAGVGEADLDVLVRSPEKLPAEERRAVAFAATMSSAAFSVTDAAVAALVKAHGQKAVVAMVQLVAYSNFQDRLILSLGLGSHEPMPPVEVRFAKWKDGPVVPERVSPKSPGGDVPAKIADREWLSLDYDALQKRLATQKAREPRIKVPTAEEYARANPGGRATRIRWSLVCGGYQPDLAAGWSAATGGFRADARQDRAFEELMFWVVTRSLTCFY